MDTPHHNDEYEDEPGAIVTGRYRFDDLAEILAAESGITLDEAERAIEDFMFWQ